MTTEFVVVRHGETDANLNGILQGQSDVPLNELGLRQAEAVAERLQHEHFDHIFSSDLSRAMVTAQTIARFHSLPVVGLRALREWNLGVLQGGRWADLAEKYPEVDRAFREGSTEVKVPGGESISDLHQRVADCLDELADRYEGKRLLLISHGGAIKQMFRHVVCMDIGEFSRMPLTGNTGVGSFRRIEGKWQLVSWNDMSHLRGLEKSESVTF